MKTIPGFKISPDGRRVYVTKNWADNGVAMFARDAAAGALSFLDGICELDPDPIGINLPKEMALGPRGAYPYVAGNASDAVAVFDTGLLGDGIEGSP